MLPCKAGIGLRIPHYEEILTNKPAIAWFEVHNENYFAKGGKTLANLEEIRKDYPLSLHGVGLSLGSTHPLNQDHLVKLKKLVDRFEPALVSEHLCWSSISTRHLNDLLPIPYHGKSLKLIVAKIQQVQDYLQRQILIENITSYLQYNCDEISEAEFIAEVLQQSGCGLLLDVSNLYINSVNHGWDLQHYLQTIPAHAVQEIHLGGFTPQEINQATILIDTHDQIIAAPVWTLYQQTLERFGAIPTLIEWDKDIPTLQTLMNEAEKANHFLANYPSSAQIKFSQNHPEAKTTHTDFSNALPYEDFAHAIFAETIPENFERQIITNGLTIAERLNIYRNNIFSTLQKTLQKIYPSIEKLIGEDFFAIIAKSYINQHPSTAADLSSYGEFFSQHLSTFASIKDFPYLPEVAKLEWARHEIFYEQDSEPFDFSSLANISSDAYEKLQFTLNSSVRILSCQFPVLQIWQACQQELGTTLKAKGENILVTRLNTEINCQLLSSAEYIFLEALNTGKTFKNACNQALEIDNDFAVNAFLPKCITSNILKLNNIKE